MAICHGEIVSGARDDIGAVQEYLVSLTLGRALWVAMAFAFLALLQAVAEQGIGPVFTSA